MKRQISILVLVTAIAGLTWFAVGEPGAAPSSGLHASRLARKASSHFRQQSGYRPGTRLLVAHGKKRDDGGSPPPDFDHPFVDGEVVADTQAATTRLSFRAAVPSELGQPANVVVHQGYRPQAMALEFRNSALGTFDVIEEPTTGTSADLRAIVSGCRPENGCVGTWSMVVLRDGDEALVVNGPEANSAIFIRNGVMFTIGGPSTTFSASASLTVANAVEHAAAP